MSFILAMVFIPFLTLFSYFFSKNPATEPFRTQVVFFFLFFLLFYIYFTEKIKTGGLGVKISTYLLSAFVLFLVSSTGWFSSPFSFTLYFLVLVLSFVFSSTVAIFFIASLLAVLFLQLDHDGLSDSFLTIVSLFFSVPITLYLRERYLRLKEANKDILILRGRNGLYQSKLGEVLENKISYFAASLRQPISTVKHLVLRLQSIQEPEKIVKIRQRIAVSADEALRILKEFEEQTTGRKLVSKEKKTEPFSPARPA